MASLERQAQEAAQKEETMTMGGIDWERAARFLETDGYDRARATIEVGSSVQWSARGLSTLSPSSRRLRRGDIGTVERITQHPDGTITVAVRFPRGLDFGYPDDFESSSAGEDERK